MPCIEAVNMFKRSFNTKDCAGKAAKVSKRSLGSSQIVKQKLLESLDAPPVKSMGSPTSAIVTLSVGPSARMFAAHEEILQRSPLFEGKCRELYFASSSSNKRIDLRHEDPETFSHVLEYLYKNDYSPNLLRNKRGWYVDGTQDENTAPSTTNLASPTGKRNEASHAQGYSSTLLHTISGETILRDTAVYCAAQAYGLPDLQKLALRKQGLQSGIDVGTILRSMRFAYRHTPDTDSRLRAHFLALIVRARKTFKRSGTMQNEMTRGGAMFFDLFVALCNHLDDIEAASTTPKTV